MIPRILLTTGEPAGIGPDLCLLLAQRSFPCKLVVAGDPDFLADRADRLGVRLRLSRYDPAKSLQAGSSAELHVLPVEVKEAPVCGVLNPANAAYVLQLIRIGAKACLERQFDALVTAPVHKGVINQAGIAFTGHTEFIAELTGGVPVMMLACPGLRVALVTTHLPLKRVSESITPERLESVLRVLHQDLRARFGIERPRILVAGLNPHAGESGYLGREEIEMIVPVLDKLRREGFQLAGPLPADTLFLPKHLKTADAVLAMYHDQGLPVLKFAGFGRAVNVTLGLPIIRTSVDHGTALDLAGSGNIDTGSLESAIETAISMVNAGAVRSASG
jgi:4-hydroxythreonine-4-phosphate dehydrogenase